MITRSDVHVDTVASYQ